MPFKSEAQRRLFHVMAEKGEISPEKVREWEHATKNKKSLPMHVKKSYALGSEVAADSFGFRDKEAVFAQAALQVAQRAAKPFTNLLHQTGPFASGKPTAYTKHLNSLQGGDALREFQRIHGSGLLSDGGMLRAGKKLNRLANRTDVTGYNLANKATQALNNPMVQLALPG
jgi:hypothetical protein